MMPRMMLLIESLPPRGKRHRVGLAELVLVAVIAANSPALAEEAGLTTTRPPPRDVPTPVSIGLYVYDVAKIDDVDQTFEADIFYTAKWRDERLRLPPEAQDRSDRLLSLWEILAALDHRRQPA